MNARLQDTAYRDAYRTWEGIQAEVSNATVLNGRLAAFAERLNDVEKWLWEMCGYFRTLNEAQRREVLRITDDVELLWTLNLLGWKAAEEIKSGEDLIFFEMGMTALVILDWRSIIDLRDVGDTTCELFKKAAAAGVSVRDTLLELAKVANAEGHSGEDSARQHLLAFAVYHQ